MFLFFKFCAFAISFFSLPVLLKLLNTLRRNGCKTGSAFQTIIKRKSKQTYVMYREVLWYASNTHIMNNSYFLLYILFQI